MPGRLRQGEGVSDKAQGCCLKCCEATCRVSPWNKLLCYSIILLVVATLIILIGGAFIALSETDATSLGGRLELCSGGEDLVFPLPPTNIYVWYLANTGIIIAVLVAMTAVCCFSYVGLCCGLKLPIIVKILAVIGFILLAVGISIYVAWLVVGGWLISTMDGTEAVRQPVCQRLIAYVVFMIMYIIVLIGVTIASCIWATHGTKEDDSKKARASKKSSLKMPPVSII